MSRRAIQSTFLAQAISKFTNPCILSVITLLLIAYTESRNMRELIGWVAIILLFFVLIPAVYVYVRTSRRGNRIKAVVELTIFLKQHPRDILILALLLGLPCLAILSFLEAAEVLIYTLVALIASSIVAALFNLFYRVSFHLTAITILIVMAAQVWGQAFLILLAAIPLIAWAKYHLHEHTIPQLVMGIAVSGIVSFATLFLFRRF
jgi:hypothetical protein